MPDATTQPNVLYVITHGLISLVDIGQQGFNAYIFENGNDHRYIYGDFLAEFTIPARDTATGTFFEATLQGVNPVDQTTANTLDPNLNVIVPQAVPPDLKTETRIRGVIHLPRPEEIFYFVRGDFANGVLAGAGVSKLKTVPTHISSIRVFKYSAPKLESVLLLDQHSPSLTKPLWSGQSISVTSGVNLAALHIYDEPDEPLANHFQHAIDEFKLGVDILSPTLDLKITRPAKVDPGDEALLSTPTGLLEAEVTDLVSRVIFSRVAVTAVREGALIGRDTGGIPGEVCSTVHG